MKFILCAALVAMSGMAGAAINKCVDEQGQVTFTDIACAEGSKLAEAEPEPATSSAPPVLPPVVVPAPRSRWADLPRPLTRKMVSVDAATLQAAHQNLQLQDEVHKSRRLLSAR